MRTVLGGLAALFLAAAAYTASASMPPRQPLSGEAAPSSPGAPRPQRPQDVPGPPLTATAPAPGDARPAQGDNLATIRGACDTFHPYFAMSRFVRVASRRDAPDAAAIVAIRDSEPDDRSTVLPLATHGDVGAVYGLAYDAPRGILYAGAYNKRATAFGPGGPGQVYAIDLATGNVRRLATLFGGRDAHDYIRQEDQPAAISVGRTSLADIDLDDTGDTLFVMNMAEGRIYRISTADGSVLGSFDHGGADYDWQRNARPFGLGFHEGWLYHGVVNSLEFSGGTLEAFVFRSRPDGTDMQEVVRIALRYPRYLRWAAWSSGPAQFPGAGSFMAFDAQPLLSDIEFLPAGELLLGFRDRVTDMIPGLDRRNPRHPGSGDVIPVRYADGLWAAITDPEFFVDQTVYDEATFGGLALLPGFPLSVSSARGVNVRNDVGALWFWNGHGAIAAREILETFNYLTQRNATSGPGDVEVLCPASDQPAPGAIPTATAFAVTATAAANETATAIALTPTAIPTGTPENFDVVIRESCAGDNPYAATVCYPPANLVQFGFDADTVMIFSDTPADNPVYTAARSSAVGSAWGLAYHAAQGALFVGAFQKRLSAHGPAGPGAVYRATVRDGNITTFATLDAGSNLHGPANGGDERGADAVGKASLGDIELSTDQTLLFVVNLYDRRIYRFDTATGALLGSFAHGAAGEPWAADARPFGLGFRDGRLYHGVVNSAETRKNPADLEAVVYESAPDGSAMGEVARFGLGYDRGTVQIPGVLGQAPQAVPLDWQPWAEGDLDLMKGKAQTALFPQPILTDIVFGANGDMIVGLRDRFGDQSLAFQRRIGGKIEKPGIGLGDVLRLPFNGTTWDAPAEYDRYPMPGSTAARGAMGGLAQVDAFDITLADRVRFAGNPAFGTFNVQEGALWYDADGNALRQELVCVTRLYRAVPTKAPDSGDGEPVGVPAGGPRGPARARGSGPPGPALAPPPRPAHSEWVPGKGMGDVEVLCGPPPTPTPTVTPGPTPSPSPTATATREPRPIYLPIGLNESCTDREVHADVVLVMDVSTSMRLATSANRPKVTAALDAAAAFLALMDFTPNAEGAHDQVAVVGFNDTAWIQAPLGADAAVLAAALGSLPDRMAEGTRLDLALTRGAEALAAPERIEGNTPVVVLMTDGLPNRVPTPAPDGSQDDTVRRIAAAAKAGGVQIYTIGVGRPDDPNPIARINSRLLRDVASRPDMYYETPDAEELDAIYQAIAFTIACPPGRHKWGEPWP